MWQTDFADRLESWTLLRDECSVLPLENALKLINSWWYNAPWQAYYLHWDDIETWPDPWQLLSDNTFCELARGLGILYTISMLEHKDLTSAALVLSEDDINLVVVNKEKYILNWDPEIIVNTPQVKKVKKSLSQDKIKTLYK